MKNLVVQEMFKASSLEKPYVVLDGNNVVHFMPIVSYSILLTYNVPDLYLTKLYSTYGTQALLTKMSIDGGEYIDVTPRYNFNSIGEHTVAYKIDESFSGNNAPLFYQTDLITSAVITGNCKTIGTNLFLQCSGLTSVEIGDSVTSIGQTAFASCTSLRTLTIGSEVTSIDTAAFASCTSLRTITMPKSVKNIANSAFGGCSSLTVYYNGTEEEWNNISIDTGNDALINAQIYFLGNLPKDKYGNLYTFNDLDLSVNWGESDLRGVDGVNLYYPWGGTIGYSDATDCKFTSDDSKSNMLNNISYSELQASNIIDSNYNLTSNYDAVTEALGEGYRMPTQEEFMELYNSCTYTNDTENNCYKFTSKKNSKLSVCFYKVGRCLNNSKKDNGSIFYWYSTCDIDNDWAAKNFSVYGSAFSANDHRERYGGFLIKPIKVKKRNPSVPEYVQFIDMGLPSGTKWANMNLGATSETGVGNYYQWCDKTKYNKTSTIDYGVYPICYSLSSSELKNRGILDDNNNLKPLYDVVTYEYGNGYKMPSQADWEELIANTSFEIIDAVMVLTSTINGNQIKLGIFGKIDYSLKFDGEYARYWTSTINSNYKNYANDFYFSVNTKLSGSISDSPVYYGLQIRPVYKAL